MLDLRNKSAKERAKLKGQEIAKVKPCQKTTKGIKVQIISLEPIEDGVVAFVKAWKNGVPLGFGKAGDVQIERMIVHNPPILVDDPKGDIIREWGEDEDGEKIKKTRRLKEDPKAAILEVLTHNVQLVGKEGTKIVKGKVGNTTSTFYPAAGANSPVDGSVTYNVANPGVAWSTIHDAATGTDASATGTGGFDIYMIASTTTNQWRYLGRAFYLFNTASLSGESVSSATLSIYGDTNGKTDNYNLSISITSSSPAADNALATSDYGSVGSTKLAEDFDITNWAQAYNDFALNASGIAAINTTGISKFAGRISADVENSPPSWASNTGVGVGSFFADQTGTTKDPKLVVEHSASTTSNSYLLPLLGVG